jgi:signal transduction histidine kinase
MKPRWFHSRGWRWAVAAFLVITGATVARFTYLRSPSRGLPFHDSFRGGSSEEWTAFGGTWRLADGAMRNESDERGAKLVAGSPYWRDFTITSDVELLGRQGDAGVMLRSSDEEQGVDAYSGYYVGLRSNDGNLIIGLALHGWIELAVRPMPGGVRPFHWYHLQATVRGCRITAVATDAIAGLTQSVSVDERRFCLPRGRIGIRSHSSGGVWKNFAVQAINASDKNANLATATAASVPGLSYAIDEPVIERPESGGGLSKPGQGGAWHRGPVESIANLKVVRTPSREATIRGTVILTSPRLYVQDATGGAAVLGTAQPDLKLGDEVEVHGEVADHDFSLALRNASVRLLWARAPAPPVSVTASQAATGAFDAMFIEVEGYLSSQSAGADNTLLLNLTSDKQSFRAIVNNSRDTLALRNLSRQSHLRFRGVCVVDSEYTRDLNPFVLLVPSTDDIEVLAGPPWWSARNLAVIALGLVILLLLIYLLYVRVEHWRLHAVLDERERIAHEMHDSLAQSFVGIGFQLQAISNGVTSSMPMLKKQLDLACELVRHSHEEARRSLQTLRREFLESESLHSALESFACRIVEHGMVRVGVETSGEEVALPFAIKDGLFRIGQEAIANAVRHGNPSSLLIRVDYAAGVTLVVEDDGSGFVTDGDLRGFGLGGMSKRAEAIAATFEICSAPGQGTTVRVAAPLPRRSSLLRAREYFGHLGKKEVSNGKGPEHENPYSYR